MTDEHEPVEENAAESPAQEPSDDTPAQAESSEPEQEYAYWPLIRKLAYLGLVVVCVFYLVWWVALYFMQDQIVFPRQNMPPLRATVPQDVIEYRVDTDGGEVVAWYLPAELREGQTKAAVVIYLHGGGDTIDNLSLVTSGYHMLGFGVLLPEYRGFGRSAGTPSQDAIRADLLAFYEQMLQRDDVDPQKVIYHGVGIGGAIAADLASVKEPRALILESTFESGAKLMRGMAVPSFILKNPYRTDQTLCQLAVPIMIYHGRFDPLYPIEQAKRLAQVAPMAHLSEFRDDDPDFPGLAADARFWQRHGQLLAKLDLIVLPEPVAPATQPAAASQPAASQPATSPPADSPPQ